MLSIVVDTNLIVSALIKPGSVPAILIQKWIDREFDLITCQKAIDELADVLQRPRFLKKYPISPHQRNVDSLQTPPQASQMTKNEAFL